MNRSSLRGLLVLLLVFGSLPLRGQTAGLLDPSLPGPAIGIYGGMSRGSVAADFAVDSRGVVRSGDCGRYESGSLTGIVVGAQGELPLSALVGIHGALELSMRNASMAYECVDPAGTRMPDGSVAPAVTEFRAQSEYTLATLQLGVTLRPLALPLVASLAPSISICTDASYDAREVVLSPREAEFLQGGQERPVGSGNFAPGDVSVSLGAALWYEAPLGGRWWLVPKVSAGVGLTDEIAAGGVRGSVLGATLGLLYRFPAAVRSSTPIEPGTRPIVPAR